MNANVSFTRHGSIAEQIRRLIEGTGLSLDAALYRFNHAELKEALMDAVRRDVSVRLVLDRRKYEEDPVTRDLLIAPGIPYRLSGGRSGKSSKMHHKFVILDARIALTGSYNWTTESEETNYDNLITLHEPEVVTAYQQEFELLWGEASAPDE